MGENLSVTQAMELNLDTAEWNVDAATLLCTIKG